MLDFSREAAGTKQKQRQHNTAAATAIRRLEEEDFTRPHRSFEGLHRTNWRVRLQRVSSKKCSTTLPRNRIRSLQAVFVILIIRRFKRPVNKHRPPNDVFLGNKSPVAAVEAHAAMIAHARSNDPAARRYRRPGCNDGKSTAQFVQTLGSSGGGTAGKLLRYSSGCIAVVQYIRLIQRLAIAIDDPIAQMNSVARECR